MKRQVSILMGIWGEMNICHVNHIISKDKLTGKISYMNIKYILYFIIREIKYFGKADQTNIFDNWSKSNKY